MRLLIALAAACATTAAGQPAFSNFTMVGNSPQMIVFGEVGTTNQILTATNLAKWTVLSNIVVTTNSYTFVDTINSFGPQRFYRVIDPNWPTNVPSDMALIPAGTFQMGNTFPNDPGAAQYELPLHMVYISSFYMGKYHTTWQQWTNVVAWSATHGYTFDNAGTAKGTNHPVVYIDWYDVAKWCNARSQMEGRLPSYYTDSNLTQVYTNGEIEPYVNWNAGYRLPTESEWEKAARGGATGHRFPWTNTDNISFSNANYYSAGTNSTPSCPYDVGPGNGDNSAWTANGTPYTSPVGSFPPNGYGLYDMAGNAWQWTWDIVGNYPSAAQTNPRGPATPSSPPSRVGRGGHWDYYAYECRCSYRYADTETTAQTYIGFRCVLSIP